jgi:23S rRNA pseudouridine2605 synthase
VWLTLALREGKNREVRNVLGALGLKVNRLIRVSYGPFQLGELPPGAVTEIKTRALRDQIGERIAALAGADFSGPLIDRNMAGPQAPHFTRHPEVRTPAKAGGASKGDGPAAPTNMRGSSGRILRGSAFGRAPQDDGERYGARGEGRRRRRYENKRPR